ncbi:hypothetical protein Daura_17760 [Dactylosporangium aurantiacum]|uniref:Uncharacterized protein n=1 Tax=Dactylosporangium aurantiacum TaxID=35754 RepID=A0A9Q9IQ71_9ACTN|nr:hypothetical protein [Dactylosporangium aurantiacum]MDG6109867.1 hypothetical protein [Dactylosporangium aurantiacum]UWZ57847.1 hypothetical protein Daura_17760 [Dactylosporangium aurantiacum]
MPGGEAALSPPRTGPPAGGLPDVTGLDGAHEDAHRAARPVWADPAAAGADGVPGPFGGRRPGLGRVSVAPHLAQAVFHLHDEYGYQQLFAFDDVWAANHRYLSASLRRWFDGKWDPLRGLSKPSD